MARHGIPAHNRRRHHHHRAPGGFTLVELLVVIMIVILVSAVTLPTVISALQNRQVSEGARIVQAALAGVRDSAIRANAPRGIRLLPDPVMNGQLDPLTGIQAPIAYNRILNIEPAPDHSDGLATVINPSGTFITMQWRNALAPAYPVIGGANPRRYPYPPALFNAADSRSGYGCLMVVQSVFQNGPAIAGGWPTTGPIPASPTNWFWNIRIGDRIRFNDAGNYYTVVGPMTVPNAEQFVNDGPAYAFKINGTNYGDPAGSSLILSYPPYSGNTVTAYPEFLFLVNGIDDNNNGYVDEQFDGLDENLNGVADDIDEWVMYAPAAIPPVYPEAEKWLGTQYIDASQPVPPVYPYTIVRRPVPASGARELALPAGCVIDNSTFNTTRERSRLPAPTAGPFNGAGAIDIMISQTGAVVPTTTYSSPAAFPMDGAFFHFWIGDRTDVFDPVYTTQTPTFPMLPMPQGTAGYPPATNTRLNDKYLRRDRQLVTLFTRTGLVVTNSIERFDATSAAGVNAPYVDAQNGIREAKP